MNEYCPLKTIKLSSQDKPYFNFDLKKEICEKGKTKKYEDLNKKFEAKFCLAAEKYMRGKIEDLKETAQGKAYTILKDWRLHG